MARVVLHPAIERRNSAALAERMQRYRQAREQAIDGLTRAGQHLALLSQMAPWLPTEAMARELRAIHAAVSALDPDRPPALTNARALVARVETLGRAIADRLAIGSAGA
jgi:hypothetical protein